VQLDYRRFFLESGVEAAGSQLMHLPVLRRHEPAGLPATELRTGSTAVSGPFLAGFLDGPDLLNHDGKTENTLTLRIVNTTGRPIPLSDDGDAATRFYVSFRTGTTNAEWGLLGSHSDHLDLAVEQKGWQVDNHTIRRTDPAPWERDDFLDLELTVFTAARTGDGQVIVTYENLPAHDDGDLVLLDGEWRGSMMAKVICHNDNFGHGSGYWSIEVRQSTASGQPTRHFVGGFANYPYAPKHVLWLAGDTTYSWVANHGARIAAPADFGHPDVVRIDEAQTLESYPVKTAPDSRFHAECIFISESLGGDTSPVPRGAILMWSGSMDKIPLGWALCDGSKGTPDLRGRFIVGAGTGTYDHEDKDKETFNFPMAPPEPGKKPIPGQTGGRLKVPLSLSEMPRHAHTGKTNKDGAHYHHVPVWANEDRNKTEYPPGNRYLFKDLNQAYNRAPDRAPTTSKHTSEHEHGFTTESTGGNAPHENLPPFFALCFIMKL